MYERNVLNLACKPIYIIVNDANLWRKLKSSTYVLKMPPQQSRQKVPYYLDLREQVI